jgi:hypothetical protein
MKHVLQKLGLKLSFSANHFSGGSHLMQALR